MRKILFLLCLLASNAWAATYYAAPGGGAAATCVDAGANVCTLGRAITVAGNGDTINMAIGNYVTTELGAGGVVTMTSELINLTCAVDRACILLPTTGNAIINLVTPPDNGTTTISGLVLDGSQGATMTYCIWAKDDATGIYTVNVINSSCKNPNFYGFYAQATGLNLTLTNYIVTADSTINSRSFLHVARAAPLWAAGTITVTGGSWTVAKQNVSNLTSGNGGITIVGSAAGLTASVTGWTGNITLDPALTGSGEHPCIQLINVANSMISDSTCTVDGNVGSRTTALFRIAACGNVSGAIPCLGTETPRAITNPVINNVTGVQGTTGGYGVEIGSDATSSADNQITNAEIKNSSIRCTVPATTAHGVMLGYLVGGRASYNVVDSCSINYIGKLIATTPALFSGNVSFNATSHNFRAKGALVTWLNNDAISLANSGSMYYADQDPIAPTNSTVSLYNNIGYTNGGTPNYNVFIATSSTLSVANNNDWSGFATWSIAGSAYSTLATWNADAAVGTDLAVAPLFAGGLSPTLASQLRLASGSTLRRVGTDMNIGNVQDNGNRAFMHPPSIGAWEVTSGDAAVERTLR